MPSSEHNSDATSELSDEATSSLEEEAKRQIEDAPEESERFKVFINDLAETARNRVKDRVQELLESATYDLLGKQPALRALLEKFASNPETVEFIANVGQEVFITSVKDSDPNTRRRKADRFLRFLSQKTISQAPMHTGFPELMTALTKLRENARSVQTSAEREVQARQIKQVEKVCFFCGLFFITRNIA